MKKLSKNLAILLTLTLLFGVVTPTAFAAPSNQYMYNQPGDKNYVSNTNVLQGYGSNNYSPKVTAPRAQANATFTTKPITVDGVREAAWDDATSYQIANTFNAAMTATTPAGAQGNFRLLWDGPVLYMLVEVTGDSTKSDTGTPVWSSASYTPTTDGLFVNMDVFNDQWGMENDTAGVFFLPANPTAPATSFNNSGIPSLGSFFNPNNLDYSARLKASKSSGYTATTGAGVNYTYEIALQTEGWGDAWARELKNGTKIGLELGIFNQGSSFTYWSKTQFNAGNEGGSNLPNSERVRNRDWGEVTLSGWDNAAPFAYSGWRADEDIRFWNSKSNPGGTGTANSGDSSLVWTDASKARMIAARNAYLLIKNSSTASRAEKDAAVLEVCQAFAGLKWRDTKYPDPHDLPALNTLPSVWEFFDKTKGTNGMVTNTAEWNQRKQEILDLAQFYEYGYKPKLGVDYTISLTANTYSGTGTPSVTARVTPTNVNYSGGVYQDVTINVTLPTAGVPEGQKAPIAFAGNFTANGIANIAFPSWATETRSDDGVWGNTRSGTFYKLFPYSRNSTSADASMLIADATAVSVYLDILQMAVAQNANLNARIDPTRAVTKGFSIDGKRAFVAAVFDERVKAVVAGGAGATGPANWRYNVTGQEYDFSNTIFYNPGAENIVAHGTEGPGNSYRHNRIRETELFRHFLPYGHEYVHEDGSYGYGDFSRLPFDQTSLVATFAPDRAIIIDTNMNDYNDGAVTDNMSLDIAKSVYKALGADGNNYVKFNSGNYVSSGDPHGVANATPEGHYLSDLFYGTQTLTSAEADRLNTDPYNLKVSNGLTQTPYDYYWGGFNTITGGTGGASGTNGWYYYNKMAVSPEIVINVQPAPGMNLLLGYAAGHSLSVKAENRGSTGKSLSYQWYSNTTKSAIGGTLLEGETFSTYDIPAGFTAGKYYYYVVIRSNSGAPNCTSDIAEVTVRPASNDVSLKNVAITVTSGPYYAPVTTVCNGTLDSTTTASLVYNVLLPYGTNLNNVAASTINVTANNGNAIVGTATKLDNGARWTVPITAEDSITKATCTIIVTAPFVPITTITGVPAKIAAGVGLKISETWAYGAIYNLGAVFIPENATNKTIIWTLKSSDPGLSIVSSVGNYYGFATDIKSINTTTVGAKFVLTGTVTNGAATNANYTQDFNIEFVNPVTVPVTDITNVPTTGQLGTPLLLTGTVTPANATNQTIAWTVKADGTTAPNAVITGGNILSTSGLGTVLVTATITDGMTLTGMAPGTSYTKDFTINYPNLDIASVDAAVTAIQGGTYQIPLASQTSQQTKTTWVQNAVNALIPAGNGSTATVTYSSGYVVSVAKGSVTKPATITVTELDNSLGSLTLSAGTLTPAFSSVTTSYSISVSNSVSSITATPVTKSANATLTVNGKSVTSGQTSQAISLSIGNNTISIIVTAPDGTPKNYTIIVNRARGESTSEGGNSYGGSTPTPTPTPTPVPTPTPTPAPTPAPTASTVTMQATLSGSTGTVKLDDAKAKDLLAKNTAINVPAIAGATTYSVGLPITALSGAQGGGTITVSTNTGKITIPGNMLTGASGISGKEAGIAIGQGNKAVLPADLKAALGNRPLVQLSLSVDGKQTEWNNPSASVTVSIPYAPTQDELKNPENIVVWYIDGSGKVVTVPDGRYDSKTGAVTFDTTHFSLYAVAFVQKSFSDLGSVAWAKKSIEVLAAKDIVKTPSAATYNPAANITRADFLYSLVRTLGANAKINGNFDDVSKDAYYYNEIAIAKALGITTGEGNNKFGPDSSITRQDMMAMTERALKLLKKVNQQGATSVLEKFTDKKSIAAYAANSVATIVKEGLIVGSNNKINPTGNTTRAEAAVFLYRVYNKY
jgi:hypothetical protein